MKRRDFLKSVAAGTAVSGLAVKSTVAAATGVSDRELGAAFRIVYRHFHARLEWDRGRPVVVLNNLHHRVVTIQAMPTKTLEQRILDATLRKLDDDTTLPPWYPPDMTWPASDEDTGAAYRMALDATGRGFNCKLALYVNYAELRVQVYHSDWQFKLVEALPVETLAARIEQAKAQVQEEA